MVTQVSGNRKGKSVTQTRNDVTLHQSHRSVDVTSCVALFCLAGWPERLNMTACFFIMTALKFLHLAAIIVLFRPQ